MALRTLRLALIVLSCTSASQAADPAPEAPARKPTFYVVPHTHWEGAVFKTREEYLEMGLPNILKAMRLLREQPGFRFTLDQVAYVRPFLERYPDEVADFRRFISEGRLEIAGGLDVMPDTNIPGGETFVRQIQYGKGYFREALGIDVTNAWLVDSFGFHPQIPQILALGGFKSFWFVRGVPSETHPREFRWEGIDGTRIDSYFLPRSYVVMFNSPKDFAGFDAFARERFGLLVPGNPTVDRVGPTGADVSEPEEHLAPLVDQFNAQSDAPFTLRLAVPADFEKAVARRHADFPIYKGDLNPVFQGVYSSRIELKAWMRELERRLLSAEKLGAIGVALGGTAGPSETWRGWEPVLFNETHDLSSGVMTDHVYEDVIRGYEFSERIADEVLDRRFDDLAARIDTRGQGAPLVVFNPLGWARDDIAEVDLGFGQGNVRGVSLTDDGGNAVPAQILASTRYHDGTLKTARVAFLARSIPAMGHRVFHASPSPAEAPPVAPTGTILENALHRVEIDAQTGAITGLRLKSDGWEALAAPGNVVSREEDRGDLWELYKGLAGGMVRSDAKQELPKEGKAIFSNAERGEPTIVVGPVLSEVRVSHPFGSGQFATSVRVTEGLRRIEVTTRLVNSEKFVRYQAQFPTTVASGTNTHEIPFGALERPDGIELPAQNWVDRGDGAHGLALLNVGLPGNVSVGGTMLVSLLRAHTLGAYGFGGGYEPGMSSDSGYQIGKERTMRYALVPHAGDWRDARIYRDGLEFNHPLVCRKVAPHEGSLPSRWGLLDVSSDSVVVSSLAPTSSPGEADLRIYEAAGLPAPGVTVSIEQPVRSASLTNLLGDEPRVLAVSENRISIDLRPFEIKTVRLRFGK